MMLLILTYQNECNYLHKNVVDILFMVLSECYVFIFFILFIHMFCYQKKLINKQKNKEELLMMLLILTYQNECNYLHKNVVDILFMVLSECYVFIFYILFIHMFCYQNKLTNK